MRIDFNAMGTYIALLRMFDLDASQFIYLLKLKI